MQQESRQSQHHLPPDLTTGDLVTLAVNAHGGLAAWHRLVAFEAQLRFGGLAFASRWNLAGARMRSARIETRRPLVTLDDYPRPGWRGVFEGDVVRLETPQGLTHSHRDQPREAFGSIRSFLWWDDLDLLYFSGYAIWNYLCTPFILAGDRLRKRELEPEVHGETTWRRLEVEFPAAIPTHSRRQIFHFDTSGLMQRLDYTAEVFAPWAHAANFCLEYSEIAGIQVATRRRVVPRRFDGRALSGPTLVWIEISDLEVERAESND